MNNNSVSSEDPDRHFAPPKPPSNTDYRHARWPVISRPQSQTPAGQKTKPVGKDEESSYPTTPRVGVVGVCSAGKSTLVGRLKEAGYNARACAQEHSYVSHLWKLSRPDVLVYLDASLRTIRRRRRAKWQQGILDEEHRRLAHARLHCDLYVSTDGLSPDDVASRVISFLRMRSRTMDDGRRTADDGRRTMDDGRWTTDDGR